MMGREEFTFKSIERLKSRKLIGQIFEEGQSFSHFPLRIIYSFPVENRSRLQAAFSVGTKNFKKAVDRNRIRRLIKEAYRLQKGPLRSALEQNEKYLAIFVIYVGNEIPSYENVYVKMGGLLRRLVEITKKIKN